MTQMSHTSNFPGSSLSRHSKMLAKDREADLESALHSLPPLPYTYDALEPYIDTETMRLHHDGHHRAYVDKLNKCIVDEHLPIMSLENMMSRVSEFPEAVRNNGGGHWNHSFFWEILSPKSVEHVLSDELNAALTADFGGFDEFKKAFESAGEKRFGSGWVWLIRTAEGKLKVTSTSNQDNPLMDVVPVQGKPILGCDVWEHAYYLKYQNRRKEYLHAFWSVLNWSKADDLFRETSHK